jgi:hypothetical protein
LTLSRAATVLEANGFHVEWHDDWSFDDLRDAIRNGFQPIVGVERRFFGYPSAAHAVVITNVESSGLRFLDPLIGPDTQECSLPTFLEAWESAGREALILLNIPDQATGNPA